MAERYTAEASLLKDHEKLSVQKWGYEDFKTFLIGSEKYYPLAETKLPKVIDLGKFDKELEALIAQTNADPNHRERGQLVKIDIEGKLKILNQPTIGKGDTIAFGIKTDGTPVPLSDTEKVVLLLHSHTMPLPPSDVDLSALVSEDGVTASMVGTPGLKFLILKSMETEDMLLKKEKIKEWVVQRRASLYNRVMNDPRRPQEQIQYELITEICKEYHLAIYVAEKGTRYSKIDL